MIRHSDSDLDITAPGAFTPGFRGPEATMKLFYLYSGAMATPRQDPARRRSCSGPKRQCLVVVAKLERRSRDVAFISGLTREHVPFIVTELGADAEPRRGPLLCRSRPE